MLDEKYRTTVNALRRIGHSMDTLEGFIARDRFKTPNSNKARYEKLVELEKEQYAVLSDHYARALIEASHQGPETVQRIKDEAAEMERKHKKRLARYMKYAAGQEVEA